MSIPWCHIANATQTLEHNNGFRVQLQVISFITSMKETCFMTNIHIEWASKLIERASNKVPSLFHHLFHQKRGPHWQLNIHLSLLVTYMPLCERFWLGKRSLKCLFIHSTPLITFYLAGHSFLPYRIVWTIYWHILNILAVLVFLFWSNLVKYCRTYC